jgi:hypothetical protein
MNATRIVGITGFFAIMLMAVGCSSKSSTSSDNNPATTPVPATAKKEPVPYTAKSCLSQMTGVAARWQPDALPFHMESGLNAESNGRDGKSTIWRAMFASPSRGTYRAFTCSGSRLLEEAPVGVTSTAETAYGPDVPPQIFQSVYLIADSDKAFALAQEKGGANLLEKDPKQPVVYSLDWDPKHKQLLWSVIYGTARNDSKGTGVIDASTGKFLRAVK